MMLPNATATRPPISDSALPLTLPKLPMSPKRQRFPLQSGIGKGAGGLGVDHRRDDAPCS